MGTNNNSEHTKVRRPIIYRPTVGTRRIGLPMYWDPDPPAPQAPATAPVAPPSPEPPPQGDGGSAAELAKLRRENERMAKALSDRQAAEAKAKTAAEERDREAAAKRGEWERLYGEEQANGKTLAEQLEAERVAKGELETFLRDRTESALKAVADDGVRKAWKAALDGQTPLQAQRTLDALLATLGTAQQSSSPRPGVPGRSKTVVDLRELSRNTPQNRARLNEIVMSDLKGKG